MRWMLAFLWAGLSYAQDDLVAELKDQSQCNNRILASKGIKKGEKLKTKGGVVVELDRASSFYRRRGRASVVFPEDKVWIESPDGPDGRIRIPGCFILNAKDVLINRPLRTLTAEMDMRIGAIPDRQARVRDWPKPLPCQQDNFNSTCPCGLKDTCFYCDFCKNIKSHIPEVESEKTGRIRPRKRGKGNQNLGRATDLQLRPTGANSTASWVDPTSCDCNIEPGRYDIRARVCTPNQETLDSVLPAAVVALVQENREKAADGADPIDTEFTLYTIVSLYDDRFEFAGSSEFQSLAKPAQKARLFKHRGDHLVGCHFIVTDVIV